MRENRTSANTKGRMNRYPRCSGKRSVGIAEKRRERECARPNAVASNGPVNKVVKIVLGAASSLTTSNAAPIEGLDVLCGVVRRRVLR